MKQYTTNEQTAKLIELGVEMPKSISGYIETLCSPIFTKQDFSSKSPIYDYSIGELIGILPKKVTNRAGRTAILQMTCYQGVWRVKYAGAPDMWLTMNEELIDALYDTLVEVKTNAKEYGYEL